MVAVSLALGAIALYASAAQQKHPEEADVHTLPARRPVTSSPRLLAVATALAASGVLVLSPAARAATSHVSQGRLSAARAAVEQSGVEGIAWYIDSAAGRVVVSADSTVSAAEQAAIKQRAGTDA